MKLNLKEITDSINYFEIFDKEFAVLLTDKSANFVYVNDLLCEILGYSSDELVTKNASVLKSGIHDELFYNNLWSKLEKGESWRGVFCNKTKNGELIWLDTLLIPVKTYNFEGYLGIRFDQTQYRKKISQFEDLSDKAIAMSKMALIGEMATFLVHDINGAFSVLNLTLEKLERVIAEKNQVKIKENFEKAMDAMGRINGLLNTLRSYSLVDNDETKFAIKEIINDSKIILSDFIKKNNTKIIWPVIEKPVWLKGNKGQIVQVLVEIIQNAVEAIKHTPNPVIEINFEVNKEQMTLKIKDCGIVSTEVRQNFFKPYFSTKPKGVGTGLGLTSALEIIQRHGGDIFLDPKEVQTTIVINLPLGSN